MLKKFLIGLAILVLGFGGYVAVQPAEYSVTRSTTITASPESVFQHLNDFHKWQAWSPWAKLDPNAKVTYEGPASGQGAIMKWSGNDTVGEGGMTITESRPSEALAITLDFVRPFEDTANVTFDLAPEGKETTVIWTLSGSHGFVERAIFTLMRMNMDQMVGPDYEKGLANLKAIIEGT